MANLNKVGKQRKQEQSLASLLSGGVVFTFIWATLLAIGVGGVLGIFFARYIGAWQISEVYRSIIQEVSQPLSVRAYDEVSRTAGSFSRNDQIRLLRISSLEEDFIYTLNREAPLYPIKFSETISYNGEPIGKIEFTAENSYLKNYGYILLWIILFIVFINLLSLMLTTGYLFRNYLRKPIQQVVEVVNAYNEGNFNIPPPNIQYTEFKPILSLIIKLGKTITDQMTELRNAEQKYRSMFDYGVIGIFQSTLNGRFLNLNPVLAKMLGYHTPEEAIQNITDITTQLYANPLDRVNLINELRHTNQVINTLINFKRKNGEQFVGNISMRAVKDEAGNIQYLEGFIEDFSEHKRVLDELTQYRLYLEELVEERTVALSQQNVALQREIAERKLIEEALRKSEERYRLLAENASDVIWTIDPQANITYVSPAVTQLRGYTPEEVMQLSLEENLTPASVKIMQQKLDQYLRPPDGIVTNGLSEIVELELTCKDGSTVWTETMISRLFDKGGNFIGLLGVTRDISEKKKAREKLHQLAITDMLTGIFNRAHFYELANLEIQRARRYNRDLSVILFDIDGFKQINDTYGHFAGDEVLRSLTQLCKQLLRENDIFARFGGDEFVVLLPETSHLESLAVASRLQQGVENLKILYDNELLQVTVSLGTSSLSEARSENLDYLLNLADQALYLAKSKGRNQVASLVDHLG